MGQLKKNLSNSISPNQPNKQKNMAFYINEQPAFTMEHLHPAFCRNFRYASRPRYWNLFENLFEQDTMSCQSNQVCCESKSMKKSVEKSSTEEGKPENQVEKTNEENKAVKPTAN